MSGATTSRGAIGRSTNQSHNMLKFGVISPSQSPLYLFIVSDLLFMFFSGLGMEPIAYLKIA